MSEGAACSEGRRPKASGGGNRGHGHEWWCGARYGDLGATRTAAYRGRCDAANWWRELRAMNEWGIAMTAASLCAIRGARWLSGRAVAWPIERRRAERASLLYRAKVMRYRSC